MKIEVEKEQIPSTDGNIEISLVQLWEAAEIQTSKEKSEQ
jgi:hypothetical protein